VGGSKTPRTAKLDEIGYSGGWSIHDVDVAFIGSPPKTISLATRNGKY
jgi:hypothetical protein